MRNRGFTLVEMLVATGVFLIGFTAAYAMFATAASFRVQADGILRLSLVAASIIEEIRLEAGRESNPDGTPATGIPFAPSTYVGDGFANVASPNESDTDINTVMYRYEPQPGIWYRVLSCVDEKGDSLAGAPGKFAELATTLQLDIIIVWNPLPDPTLTLGELARRQRFDLTPYATDSEKLDALVDYIAKRGFALRERAVIVRRASWER
ncbi:MAG: prepilin-type N-terminal cleavage/methylation domain-containing protein [Planctomycetota bacterium]